MPYAAVSSFSMHSRLGPIHLETRDDHGVLQPLQFVFPKQYSFKDFAEIAQTKLGVKAIELCQLQFDDVELANVDALRRTLDDRGMKTITMPIDVGDLTAESDIYRSDDVRRIARWFEVGARLGVDFVRVNANSPYGGAGEASKGVVNALKDLSDQAQKLNLRLLVENHGGSSSNADFMLQLLDDVGRDRLGLLLDLGNFEPLIGVSHARFQGRDAQTDGLDFNPVYESIRRLAPFATLVHAKAIDPGPDGKPLLDLTAALGIVASAGYSGSVSVEWEGQLGDPWERTAETLSIVRSAFPDLL